MHHKNINNLPLSFPLSPSPISIVVCTPHSQYGMSLNPLLVLDFHSNFHIPYSYKFSRDVYFANVTNSAFS